MLIWQGVGTAALLPGLLIWGLIRLFQATPLSEPRATALGWLLGSLVGAAGLWWFNRWLQRFNYRLQQTPEMNVNPLTGRHIVYEDSFFFIPLFAFPWLYLIPAFFAAIVLVKG
jgi:hypothetical protein